MKRLLIFAQIALLLFWFHSFAVGQKQTEKKVAATQLFVRHSELSFLLGIDGGFRLSRMQQQRFIEPFEFHDLLQSEMVRKELELDKDQQRKVEDILDRVKREKESFIKRYVLYKLGDDRAKARAQYVSDIEKNADVLKDVLLPHQRQRLEELNYRVQLRLRGWFPFLKMFAKRIGLSLTDAELHKLEEKLKQTQKEYLQKIRNKTLLCLRNALEDIPAKQKSELLSSLKKSPELTNFDLLRLRYHQFQKKSDKEKQAKTEVGNLAQRLTRNEKYVLGVDGQWKHKVTQTRFSVAVGYWIKNMHNQRGLNIELLDEQVEQLKELNEQLNKRSIRNYERYNTSLAQNGETQATLDLKRQGDQELDKFAKEQLFSQILLPHQKKQLEQYQRIRERKQLGMFAILDDPNYTVLTKSQCKTVLRKLKREMQTLEKAVVTLESNYHEDVLAVLSSSNKKTLLKALGDRPKFLLPSVMLATRPNKLHSNARVSPGGIPLPPRKEKSK